VQLHKPNKSSIRHLGYVAKSSLMGWRICKRKWWKREEFEIGIPDFEM